VNGTAAGGGMSPAAKPAEPPAAAGLFAKAANIFGGTKKGT
jgi:hypothetical protein